MAYPNYEKHINKYKINLNTNELYILSSFNNLTFLNKFNILNYHF